MFRKPRIPSTFGDDATAWEAVQLPPAIFCAVDVESYWDLERAVDTYLADMEFEDIVMAIRANHGSGRPEDVRRILAPPAPQHASRCDHR